MLLCKLYQFCTQFDSISQYANLTLSLLGYMVYVYYFVIGVFYFWKPLCVRDDANQHTTIKQDSGYPTENPLDNNTRRRRLILISSDASSAGSEVHSTQRSLAHQSLYSCSRSANSLGLLWCLVWLIAPTNIHLFRFPFLTSFVFHQPV